jgi:hypothetical protein
VTDAPTAVTEATAAPVEATASTETTSGTEA